MLKQRLSKILPVLLGLAMLGPFLLGPKTALAANPTTINFQGKVVNSDGTNVANGTYSIVFRIYNTSSPTMTTTCTSTASCLWQGTQSSVTVTNGIFQVQLGSSCALTSNACNNTAGGPINFASDNSLYLTMQFNGDTSGSNGGFMSPLIQITSVPFAFQADNASNLGGIAAANYVQLATGNVQADSTTNNSIAINKTGASGNILFLESNGKAALTVNNAGSLFLGQAGASGLAGTLVFNNSAGSGTASITLAANPSTSYTYQLPTGTVGSNQCLQSGTVSGGNVPLSFGTCSTLASAYNSTGTTGNTIVLTQSGDGINIQDASTPLTPGGTDLFAVQKNGGTVTYLGVSATGINIQSNYTGAAVNALAFDTSAATPTLKVYGSGGTNYAEIYYDDSTSTAYFGANVGTAVLGSGTGDVSISAGTGYGFTITGNASSTISTSSGTLAIDGSGGLNLGTSTSTVLIGDTTGGSTQVQSANGLILGTASLAGQLAVYNGANKVTIKAGSSTTAYNLILPASAGSTSQCLVNTATAGTLQWMACGAGSTATVTLAPEYPGAVMTGSGGSNTGTMTSDFCSGSGTGGLNINASICGTGSASHNYYSWTANATNNYDVWVRWQVPSDFASFGSNAFTFNGWTSSTSDSAALTVYDPSNTSCGTATISTASAAFTTASITPSGCTVSAGNILSLKVHLNVGVNGEYARAGEITIVYNRN